MENWLCGLIVKMIIKLYLNIEFYIDFTCIFHKRCLFDKLSIRSNKNRYQLSILINSKIYIQNIDENNTSTNVYVDRTGIDFYVY